MRNFFKKLLNNYIIANIRTGTPIAVGFVVAWLASKNIQIDVSREAMEVLIAGIASGASYFYYAIVSFLERKLSPKFGWLLGRAGAPSYTPAVVEPEAQG